MINPQRPFAYLLENRKHKVLLPYNYKWDYFPSNYAGMCIGCLKPVQKVREPYCTKCGNFVKEFPQELLPWMLLPPTMPSPTDRYVKSNIRFSCSVCGTMYIGVSIFAALCVHPNHSILKPREGIACRFCCTKRAESFYNKIKKASASKEKVSDNKELTDIEYAPLDYRTLLVNQQTRIYRPATPLEYFVVDGYAYAHAHDDDEEAD